MVLTVPGMIISLRGVSVKAFTPITLTVAGNSTLVKFVPKKAQYGISGIPLGIVTLVRDVQL